jgi:outer membrane protein OmpA-like peptidoglycan-associated protein
LTSPNFPEPGKPDSEPACTAAARIFLLNCSMLPLIRCLFLPALLAIVHLASAQEARVDTLVVHFAFNRSAIRTADSAAVTGYFQDTAHAAMNSVHIIGYTDTTGSEHYNKRLSQRRALSVAALAGGYVPAACLRSLAQVEARGEADPLPGDDSLSRRALLIVYYRIPPASIAHIDTPQRVKAPGEPDTVLTLNHINFIANKAELTQAALDALPSNVANLRPFQDRYLEIDGYCNQPGPPLPRTDVLFILSVDRAKYIYHYLITQGFDAHHLSYKGLGNASPVNAHPTTTSEMDQNMRVEIKVFSDPPKPSTAQ